MIDPGIDALDRFLAALSPSEYYVDPEVARTARRARGMFNVIDMASSWKADLVIRKDRPFSHEELRRRLAGEVMGVPCMLATREDVILSKLEWAHAGGSERQLDDVAGIVATQGAALDVADLWARVRAAR